MDNQKKKMLIASIITVVVFGSFNYFNLTQYLNLSYVHSNMNLLQTLINEHYIFAVCCFMFSFIMATAFSIPGSSVFTTVAGLLFGWSGLLYALIAATGGATLLFLASRYFIGSWVQHKYAKELIGFNKEMQQHGHKYLLLIRLIAVLPFCLVNMLSGLTLLSVSTFSSITLLGLIPVSIVYIFAGKHLAYLASPDELFSPPVMIAFTVFILFKVALAPAIFKIAKRLIRKRGTTVRQTVRVAQIPSLVLPKRYAHQKQS